MSRRASAALAADVPAPGPPDGDPRRTNADAPAGTSAFFVERPARGPASGDDQSSPRAAWMAPVQLDGS